MRDPLSNFFFFKDLQYKKVKIFKFKYSEK